MGKGPDNLGHVQAPWDPTQASAGIIIPINDLLGKARDKIKEKLAPVGRDLEKGARDMGAAVDFLGGAMRERGNQLRDLGNDVLQGSSAQAPSLDHTGSREETGAMKGSSVAHETVPPEPSRERNKCSSPSRGGS